MKYLKFSEILGKDHFDSYHEFIFGMSLVRVAEYLGYGCDMRNFYISNDASTVPLMKLLYYLINKDVVVVDDTFYRETVIEVPKLYFDLGFLDMWLLKDVGNNYIFDSFYIKENTVSSFSGYFLKVGQYSIHLMCLVANFVLKKRLGLDNHDKFILTMTVPEVKSVSNYISLYGCIQSMPWLSKLVELDISKYPNIDYDFYLFRNDSNVIGKRKYYEPYEKVGLLEKSSIYKGHVGCLWRMGYSSSDKVNYRIKDVDIAILRDFDEKIVSFDIYKIDLTNEEKKFEFEELDDDIKAMFEGQNPQENKLVSYSVDFNWNEVAVDRYINSEENVYTSLDIKETKDSIVTFDDEIKAINLPITERIYWILCQMGVEFNKELYRFYYNNGRDMLYDLHGWTF